MELNLEMPTQEKLNGTKIIAEFDGWVYNEYESEFGTIHSYKKQTQETSVNTLYLCMYRYTDFLHKVWCKFRDIEIKNTMDTALHENHKLEEHFKCEGLTTLVAVFITLTDWKNILNVKD